MILLTQKKMEHTHHSKRRRLSPCRHVIAEDTGNTPSFINPWFLQPLQGTVIHAAPDGEYTILEPIVTIQLPDGTEKELALAQKWPIRIPRPTTSVSQQAYRLSPDSVSSILFSRLPRAVLLPFPADSEQEKP